MKHLLCISLALLADTTTEMLQSFGAWGEKKMYDKHFVIPGTEDMVSAYHDYWFHIKGGFIGMVLAIPSVLIAGVIVIL